MFWFLTGRCRTPRASIGLVAILILMMSAPTAGSASQGPRDPAVVEAQEVRTVWTSEFGLDRPSGMTYLAGSSEFIVVGDPSTGSGVILGSDENMKGRVVLGPVERPATLSYDPRTGAITAFDGVGRLEWSPQTIGTSTGQGRRSAGGTDARSAAYEPASGDLLLLSSNGKEITRVGSESTSKIRLNTIPQARLIASNSHDSLIYVMTADHDVVAIDSSGAVVQDYDLSGVELGAPTAIVFAPSSDATDAATNLNLYVADAGSSKSFGGVVEISLATTASPASVPVDVASLVRATATSAWNPGSPDPAGVTYLTDSDTLIVVDSEVDEVTGAGWNNVNMWRSTRAGSVTQTGTFWGANAATYNGKVGFSKEPTGASYSPHSQTLFVSDDYARKIFTIKTGVDGLWGTRDDLVGAVDAAGYGSTDTEDPEFDVVSGHLFFLDGVGMEVYRVDPVDGLFGNGNDLMSQFDISHLGPTDFEGLASNPTRDTLFVGARTAKRIFEMSKSGAVLREISVSGITGLRYISGLAYAPSSDDPNLMSLYIVDRQIDNGPDPNENDGRLWEVRAPDSLGGGGTPQNQPPVVNAGPDVTLTLPAVTTLAGTVSDDGLPAGAALTAQWTIVTVPAGGGVAFANENEPSTTATFSGAGTYVLRLTASDTQASSFDEVIVQVNAPPTQATEFRAVSQTPVYGTVTGGLENTHVADGLTQVISEVTSSGGNRAKLEQVWTFDITGNSRLTFVLDATRTGTEDHRFAYSMNGGSSWKTMVTVNGSTHYEFLMPTGVTGPVLVRLKDLNRDRSDTSIDSLAIDRMVFVSAP